MFCRAVEIAALIGCQPCLGRRAVAAAGKGMENLFAAVRFDLENRAKARRTTLFCRAI